jgi:hypothetical protein
VGSIINFKGGEDYIVKIDAWDFWMVDLYNVGTSTIRKYIVAVCEIFSNQYKSFGIYIHTSSTSWLQSITQIF